MARVVDTVLKVTPDKRGVNTAVKDFTALDRAISQLGEGLGVLSPRAQKAASQLAKLGKERKLDASQFELAAANIGELDARLKVVTAELAEARAASEGLDGDAAVKQAAKVAKLEKQYISLRGSILDVPRKISDAYEKVEERARKAADAQTRSAERAEAAARGAAGYDAQRSGAARRVGVFGDVDTALATFGSAAAGIGGSTGGRQLQGQLTAAADIFAVTEQVGLLVPVFKSVGTTAKTVASSGGLLGTVAKGAQAAIPALGATGAGLLAIGAAALPLAILLGGAVVALQAFNKQQEKVAKAARRNAELVGGVSNTYADANAALRAGDTDALGDLYQSALDEVDRANDVAQRQLTEVQSARSADQAEEAGNNLLENFFDPFYSTNAEAGFRELNTQYQESVTAQVQAEASLIEIRRIAAAQGIDLDEILRQNSEEVQAFIQAEEDLAAMREQTQDTLASLAEQEGRVLEQTAQQNAQILEDRAIAERREQEDYEAQVAEHQVRLKDIRTDGLERIAKLEEDSRERITEIREDAAARDADLVAKAAEAVTKVTSTSQDKIADIQADTVERSLKLEEKYAQDRLRAQQNLQDKLFDAELSNDILAITRARRAAEREEQRAAEDFGKQQSETASQAAARIAETRNEAAERVAAIREGLVEQRAALRADTATRIAEEREALKERVAAEKEAIAESVAAELESQARLDAARQLRLQRQEEDERLQDKRRRDAIREQLRDIEDRRIAEVRALREAAEGVNTLALAAGEFSEVAQSVLSEFTGSGRSSGSGSSSSGGSSAGGFFGNAVSRFADGGIVPRRASGLGFFEPNRSFDEAVIPLTNRNLQSIGAGVGGGRSITLNINAPIGGNNVSREEVRAELLEFARVINEADSQAIRGVG